MATGITLSVISGLGFGFVGVAARLMTVHSSVFGWLSDAFVWAMVLMGSLAVVAYGYALDRLPTTTVAAPSFACETIAPSAIGLIWLGDEVRPGLMWLAEVGFVAVLGRACSSLAKRKWKRKQQRRGNGTYKRAANCSTRQAGTLFMVPAQEVPHHVGGLKRVVIRPFPTFLLVGRSRLIVATISDGEVFNVDSRAAPSPPHAGDAGRRRRRCSGFRCASV